VGKVIPARRISMCWALAVIKQNARREALPGWLRLPTGLLARGL